MAGDHAVRPDELPPARDPAAPEDLDDKPGIWFFTLDAASQLAVEGAKRIYKLPYHHARMTAERHAGFVHYESARSGATFSARYRGEGDFFNAEPGSLEYFLAERYCLYTADGGRVYRAEIHHPPWPLQRCEVAIDLNTMSPVPLPDDEPHALYSVRQDVVIWSLTEVESTGGSERGSPGRNAA